MSINYLSSKKFFNIKNLYYKKNKINLLSNITSKKCQFNQISLFSTYNSLYYYTLPFVKHEVEVKSENKLIIKKKDLVNPDLHTYLASLNIRVLHDDLNYFVVNKPVIIGGSSSTSSTSPALCINQELLNYTGVTSSNYATFTPTLTSTSTSFSPFSSTEPFHIPMTLTTNQTVEDLIMSYYEERTNKKIKLICLTKPSEFSTGIIYFKKIYDKNMNKKDFEKYLIDFSSSLSHSSPSISSAFSSSSLSTLSSSPFSAASLTTKEKISSTLSQLKYTNFNIFYNYFSTSYMNLSNNINTFNWKEYFNLSSKYLSLINNIENDNDNDNKFIEDTKKLYNIPLSKKFSLEEYIQIPQNYVQEFKKETSSNYTTSTFSNINKSSDNYYSKVSSSSSSSTTSPYFLNDFFSSYTPPIDNSFLCIIEGKIKVDKNNCLLFNYHHEDLSDFIELNSSELGSDSFHSSSNSSSNTSSSSFNLKNSYGYVFSFNNNPYNLYKNSDKNNNNFYKKYSKFSKYNKNKIKIKHFLDNLKVNYPLSESPSNISSPFFGKSLSIKNNQPLFKFEVLKTISVSIKNKEINKKFRNRLAPHNSLSHFSVIKINPVSNHPYNIRKQLASYNYPILGDIENNSKYSIDMLAKMLSDTKNFSIKVINFINNNKYEKNSALKNENLFFNNISNVCDDCLEDLYPLDSYEAEDDFEIKNNKDKNEIKNKLINTTKNYSLNYFYDLYKASSTFLFHSNGKIISHLFTPYDIDRLFFSVFYEPRYFANEFETSKNNKDEKEKEREKERSVSYKHLFNFKKFEKYEEPFNNFLINIYEKDFFKNFIFSKLLTENNNVTNNNSNKSSTISSFYFDPSLGPDHVLLDVNLGSDLKINKKYIPYNNINYQTIEDFYGIEEKKESFNENNKNFYLFYNKNYTNNLIYNNNTTSLLINNNHYYHNSSSGTASTSTSSSLPNVLYFPTQYTPLLSTKNYPYLLSQFIWHRKLLERKESRGIPIKTTFVQKEASILKENLKEFRTNLSYLLDFYYGNQDEEISTYLNDNFNDSFSSTSALTPTSLTSSTSPNSFHKFFKKINTTNHYNLYTCHPFHFNKIKLLNNKYGQNYALHLSSSVLVLNDEVKNEEKMIHFHSPPPRSWAPILLAFNFDENNEDS